MSILNRITGPICSCVSHFFDTLSCFISHFFDTLSRFISHIFNKLTTLKQKTNQFLTTISNNKNKLIIYITNLIQPYLTYIKFYELEFFTLFLHFMIIITLITQNYLFILFGPTLLIIIKITTLIINSNKFIYLYNFILNKFSLYLELLTFKFIIYSKPLGILYMLSLLLYYLTIITVTLWFSMETIECAPVLRSATAAASASASASESTSTSGTEHLIPVIVNPQDLLYDSNHPNPGVQSLQYFKGSQYWTEQGEEEIQRMVGLQVFCPGFHSLQSDTETITITFDFSKNNQVLNLDVNNCNFYTEPIEALKLANKELKEPLDENLFKIYEQDLKNTLRLWPISNGQDAEVFYAQKEKPDENTIIRMKMNMIRDSSTMEHLYDKNKRPYRLDVVFSDNGGNKRPRIRVQMFTDTNIVLVQSNRYGPEVKIPIDEFYTNPVQSFTTEVGVNRYSHPTDPALISIPFRNSINTYDQLTREIRQYRR